MADRSSIDAKLTAERARIVRALRDLADRLERAPLDHLSGPLTIAAGLVEQLAKRIEQIFGSRPTP